MQTHPQKPILSVNHLSIDLLKAGTYYPVIDDIHFSLYEQQTLGIVGESGCGKSVLALSLLRLLPINQVRYIAGQVWFDDQDLLQIPCSSLHQIRGGRIGFVFQEPMTVLNPIQRVGEQFAQAIRIHKKISKKTAFSLAAELLVEVGVDAKRLNAYPHELSGGLMQRMGIAMALAADPSLLIADEPTSALDMCTKLQIMELLQTLKQKRKLSLLLITHELGLARHLCDRIIVMYAGQIVEQSDVTSLWAQPLHPYTQALLATRVGLASPLQARLNTIPGQIPSIGKWPNGCRFQERCFQAVEACAQPQSIRYLNHSAVRCHRAIG